MKYWLLRITASVDLGRLVLSPLLREFMQIYPDIRIDYAMPPGDLKMVYPDRKHLALKTRCFLDFMAEQAATHPAFDCDA